jgi:3-oxoacyl-[acyl-carrier protein] reductase
MELSLKGKKVLITGAGAGIGLACANAFVTAGADVAICDVEQARLDEALASLTAIGGKHYG